MPTTPVNLKAILKAAGETYQIGRCGKIETRKCPGVRETRPGLHQGVSLMRPDDTVPSGAVLIPLRAADGVVRAYAIVDAVDADWIKQWRWCLDNSGYARRSTEINGVRRGYLMHRELIGLSHRDGREVDHINRDRLDNRRANLRAIPLGKNQQNKSRRRGASSRFRGVSLYKRSGKWLARVRIGGRLIYLGYFDTEQEAAQAALEGRQMHMPYAVD